MNFSRPDEEPEFGNSASTDRSTTRWTANLDDPSFFFSSYGASTEDLSAKEGDINGGGASSSMTTTTSPTDTGSISEDDSWIGGSSSGGGSASGWLGGITADFKTLALSVRETAGGMANFVQRSAMAVASEIAHLEAEAEEERRLQQELRQRQQQKGEQDFDQQHCYDDDHLTLHLPWEVLQYNHNNQDGSGRDQYVEDEVLKEKIQALSSKEETFLRPYSVHDVHIDEGGDDEYDDDEYDNDNDGVASDNVDNEGSCMRPPPFILDEARIQLVHRILANDTKLAAMHAKLSGRSDVNETVFWQNYFFNVEMTREEYFVLLDPPVLPPSSSLGNITGTPAVVTTSNNAESALIKMESFNEDDDDENNYDCSEESSFVKIPSPPASQRSIGSLVMINPHDTSEMP